MPVETCPLCMRMYARLSQHLSLMHHVENKEERKLLLAMESGRINARVGKCPIAGCGKFSNRLDLHVRTHTEISLVAQDQVLLQCKRKEIISKLTALRASNPKIPMVSTLDLEEHCQPEDAWVPLSAEDLEEEECDKEGCKAQKDLLRRHVADLQKQCDVLTESLRTVTKRYRVLKRKSASLGAASPAASIPTFEGADNPIPEAEKPKEKSPPHYPDHVAVLNEIVEGYRRHLLGPEPTRKIKENVGAHVYRIKKCIAYMSEGKSKLADFCFLNETAKIHIFIHYIAEAPPPSCHLSKNRPDRTLPRDVKSPQVLKRGVALHQISVKAKKESHIILKSTLLQCRKKAAQAIPELLIKLENEPSQKNQWQLYGHFTALLSSLYGHRGGVYQNITIQEVLGAQKSTSQKSYVINVTSHKTNEDAWKSMGLPGCPTFTDVRSSIASHAKFLHSSDISKISKFMCHDVKTADNFYVTNLSAQQAMEHR
ncbi:hypothetical protein QQF64_020396 [Cirrhinus molitorella]|uniref:C2H2-type domain-containing protein n=1 Tax=Cirrhinus molitorella TaxID=172907 RepID=A0ABR3LBE0_9TELE